MAQSTRRGATKRWLTSLTAVCALLVAACSGQGAPEDGAASGEETLPVEEPAETPSEPTTSLAFVESDVALAGATHLQVHPGETVITDYLVYNTADGTQSVRLGTSSVDGLDVELSITSVRLSPDESRALTSTLTVPASAAVGDVLSFRVQAAVPGGDAPAITDVQLTVAAESGERPEVASTSGSTSTNEKVLVYVLGSVSDPDEDLDHGSLRVVWPGFRSDEVTAANGTVTYHPFLNVTGTDRVLFEVCDRAGWCDTGTITIEVRG